MPINTAQNIKNPTMSKFLEKKNSFDFSNNGVPYHEDPDVGPPIPLYYKMHMDLHCCPNIR